ncbi:MAG: hypothetical protein A2W80_04435 [Candidatus Riflebacteria bacterium GWC2_50_8]|nr:MAG: hypothetical protein A2W80_04435 [Candidatus Riflebacteria bacterium GWC2_50_8]
MMKKVVACFLAAFVFSLLALSTSNAADLKIKFTDKGRLNYQGDWKHISYQAYTSKDAGKGGRRGTLTCEPKLSGTYQIITEFKATVNRGNRAQYYVNGTKVKEVDQRAGAANGKSAFIKVSLGVFELTPESKVELRCEDGKSYSFVGFTFTTSTDVPTDVSADGGVAGDTGAESSFVAKSDGDLVIEPYLSTYSAAALHVLVDGKEVFSWVRSDSTSKEPCVFQGAADDKSMIENKPGDYSPAPGLKYTVALKAGQKVTSTKSGGYESGTYLKISGPFDGAAAAPAGTDKKPAENAADNKEGGKAATGDAKPAAMDDVLNSK